MSNTPTLRDKSVLTNRVLGKPTHIILASEVQRIKIGSAHKPYSRLKTLNTSSPVFLELLGFTSKIPEYIFHRCEPLQEFRFRGEWYALTDASLAVLQQIIDLHSPNCNLIRVIPTLIAAIRK